MKGLITQTGIGLVLAAWISPALAWQASGPKEVPDQVQAVAQAAGLLEDDLSPILTLEGGLPLDHPLRRRPALSGLASLASPDPGVRVYYPDRPIPGVRDRDGDGIPDRALAALQIAGRTLELCRRHGLGNLADLGNRELELFLLPLGGTVRGYAAFDRAVPPGASGFGVVDLSPSQDEPSFRGMVSRVAARLILASQAAAVPAWWAEPSAFWIQAQITGIDLEMERNLLARMNHPERGAETQDLILARGNLALLLAFQDPGLEVRALSASWKALREHPVAENPVLLIDQVLDAQTGIGLADLLLRAGLIQIVDGPVPGRWALRLSALPVLDAACTFPISPLGMALVHLTPDPGMPEATVVSIKPGGPGWSVALLAQRKSGEWETTTLPTGEEGGGPVMMPWRDYQKAVILAVRPREGSATGDLRLQAEGWSKNELFGLSSFGARTLSGGRVQVAWTSAWEDGLFGWWVERATSAEGPWSPVHEFPVPALGTPGEGTEYQVQDAAPAPLGPLYYRLAALTALGLRITGPAVAVLGP